MSSLCIYTTDGILDCGNNKQNAEPIIEPFYNKISGLAGNYSSKCGGCRTDFWFSTLKCEYCVKSNGHINYSVPSKDLLECWKLPKKVNVKDNGNLKCG
jgi:hypothetical protein